MATLYNLAKKMHLLQIAIILVLIGMMACAPNENLELKSIEASHNDEEEDDGNFENEMLIFKTKNYWVRIELLENGKYSYTSWSKGKDMTEKPDLILLNGTKKCWGEPEVGWCDCDETFNNGESLVIGERYSFISGEISYIYDNGWKKGRLVNELLVLKNDDLIMQEEVLSMH